MQKELLYKLGDVQDEAAKMKELAGENPKAKDYTRVQESAERYIDGIRKRRDEYQNPRIKEIASKEGITFEEAEKRLPGILIDELIERSDKSGPLVSFIDWEYIKDYIKKENSEEKVFVAVAEKGKKLLDKKNAGEAFYVILDGDVRYEKRDMHGDVVRSVINKPYEYFGEQAVLNDKITDSTNTVESEQAALLVIARDILLESIQKSMPDLFKKLKIHLELGLENYDSLTQELLKEGRLNVYRRYHSITTQTQKQNKMAFLLTGRAFILRDSRNIADVLPGNIIGDAELFDKDRVNISSVIADDDSVVLEIEMGKFEEIINQHRSLKLLIAENARRKEIAGRLKESTADPFEIYQYDFTKIDNSELLTDEEKKERKAEILEVARETLSMMANGKDQSKYNDKTERSLNRVFSFICKSLEDQEIDNPKYYVSHGLKHTTDVLRFAESIFDGSPTLKKDIEDVFGLEKGKIILRLVALFHDIGYPKLTEENKTKKNPKWMHQEFSGELVKKNISHELLSEIIDLSEKQYELFIEAIAHHGSDSDNPSQLSIGRPFVPASNKKILRPLTIKNEITKESKDYEIKENPILAIIRIADNLDLIEERLTKLQKNQHFMKYMEMFLNQCQEIENHFKNVDPKYKDNPEYEKNIKDRMAAISEYANEKLESEVKQEIQENPEIKEEDREKELANRQSEISEILTNLGEIAKNGDWEGYKHFQSVAIAQNVFIREKNSRLEVFVEYNESSDKLPLSLIHYQTGRLTDSVKKSLRLKNSEGEDIEVKITEIFPNPREQT